MLTTKNVQWKITICLVITVEEFTLLVAVQRIVRCVNIKDYLCWNFCMRFDKNINKKVIYRFWSQHYFFVWALSISACGCQFQPVQGALSCQRFAFILFRFSIHSGWVSFPNSYCQHLIFGQVIMIIEILIPQSQANNSLRYQRQHTVFDTPFITMVNKASGKTL